MLALFFSLAPHHHHHAVLCFAHDHETAQGQPFSDSGDRDEQCICHSFYCQSHTDVCIDCPVLDALPVLPSCLSCPAPVRHDRTDPFIFHSPPLLTWRINC